MRKLIPLAACLFVGIAITAAAQPGPEKLAGSWKVTFLDSGELLTFWILNLETKDGKLTGTPDAVAQGPGGGAPLKDVTLKGDTLTATFEYAGMPMVFTMNVPKGQVKQMGGTMAFRGNTYVAQMQSAKKDAAKDAKWRDKVDVPYLTEFKEFKEELAKRVNDLGIFVLAPESVAAAAKEKVSAADLKAALAPVLNAARDHGAWHQETLLKLAGQLAKQESYAPMGEEFAQQALKEFGAAADENTQLKCFDIIAMSLEKQNKKAELTKIRAKIDGLEIKGHEENEKAGLGFEPGKFAGRQGKRVVLVELFTGAQCPPCVAADLAFEGLAKTFKTSEVVLLQYHLHIPRPDPMTTPDSEARQQYYGKEVRGTPSIFFNGISAAGGGGAKAGAGNKYKQYRDIVDPLLNSDDVVNVVVNQALKDKNENGGTITFQPFSKIDIAADAKRTGDAIAITASAKGYKPADKLKLRLALIEPWVRYPGSNGLSYHAHVVRALPGGPDGFALDKENISKTVKVDLAEVRQIADRHLQKQDSFFQGQRAFSYRNLRLVAFVQDDDSKEILHAVEVDVK
ncbi:MAG TPA: hypothetical protein VE988_30105 [Gemmataceae bacterium]|nr:hypothetical protein [Gemmataceae bacterium]